MLHATTRVIASGFLYQYSKSKKTMWIKIDVYSALWSTAHSNAASPERCVIPSLFSQTLSCCRASGDSWDYTVDCCGWMDNALNCIGGTYQLPCVDVGGCCSQTSDCCQDTGYALSCQDVRGRPCVYKVMCGMGYGMWWMISRLETRSKRWQNH